VLVLAGQASPAQYLGGGLTGAGASVVAGVVAGAAAGVVVGGDGDLTGMVGGKF